MSQVEDSIAQHNHQFLMLTSKDTSERVVLRFFQAAFPGPLPELCLRGPELLAVAANDQCRFFLLLLFLGRAQFDSRFVGRHFDLRTISFCSAEQVDKESCRYPERGKPLMRGSTCDL